MIDWMARAKVHLGDVGGGETARTDETRLLSVSSVPYLRVAPERGGVSSVLSVGLAGIPANQGLIAITSPAAVANEALAKPGVPIAGRASGNPYMTPEQGDECHACGWDDAEIGVFLARTRRFCLIGRSDAEHLAERLTLRDRQTDDRRMCLECRELELSGRCAAARRGAIAGVDRRLEPVSNILMRCTAFRANEPSSHFLPGDDHENHQR